MSIVSDFILDLEENGYCFDGEYEGKSAFYKEWHKIFADIVYVYNSGLNFGFYGMYTVNNFPMNSEMRVSTFVELNYCILLLEEKSIKISVDTFSFPTNSEAKHKFVLNSSGYSSIKYTQLIDRTSPELSDFCSCLAKLSYETNCDFYGDPWKAFYV